MKYIHSKKYLYIDLNPSNIRFILENSNIVVKLISFNSCIKYINNNSQFYTNDKLPDKQGNNYYSSRNINLGYRGVRLDDIESILYILLDLVNNTEFLKIKTLKQIGRILNIKYRIFQNKTNNEYINNFIDLINQSISNNDLNKYLSNRSINYNKFIKIFS
jgi:serine/threonine protein kinase